MSFSIKADTAKLEMALSKLANAAKIDLGLVIKEEAKYILQTLIKFTPPKSKQQGVNEVRGDLSKLAQPLEYSDLEAKATKGGFYKLIPQHRDDDALWISMARYINTRNIAKMRELLMNPNLKGYYGMKLLENIGAIRQEHKSRRNSRGRITGKATALAFGADFKEYREEIEDRVGWSVSGWNSSAKKTGARYKKFSDKLKPQAGGSGLFGSSRSNFGPNPYIQAIAYNIKIPNYQSKIDAVLTSRIKTTERKVAAVMANRAVNLGFAKVGGAMPIKEAE